MTDPPLTAPITESPYHVPLNRAQRRHPLRREDVAIVRPNYLADPNKRKAAKAARKARRK
jgi:hypothetical protein